MTMLNLFISLLLSTLFSIKSTTLELTTTQDIIYVEAGTVLTTEMIIEEYFQIESSLPATLNIITDTYQSNSNQLGSFILVCQAKNSKNELSTKKRIIIQVHDTSSPQISLKKGGDTIVSAYCLTDEEIKDLFNISDQYDQTLTTNDIEILKNTCDGTYNKRFIIELKLSDSSGNTTIQSFNYYLVKDPYASIKLKDATPVQSMGFFTSHELNSNKLLDYTAINPNSYTYIHLENKENLSTLKQIQNKYQALEYLTFETDYNEHNTAIATYPLIISYHSLEGYVVTWTDYIVVRETHPPIINPKTTDVLIDLSNPPTEDYYNELFEISDDEKIETVTFNTEPYGNDSFLLICEAIDSSTNSSAAQILCHTYYSIKQTILPITLCLVQNSHSKQEILSFLLDEYTLPTGYLNLVLESNYFINSQNGIYTVKVTLDFENQLKDIYFFKIKLNKEQKEKKEDKTLYYCFIIVFSLLFVILFIIYRKRSNLS